MRGGRGGARRDILKAGAAIAGASLFPGGRARGADFLNDPGKGDVTLGFTVTLSGAYAEEGADELRACKLAVMHLNGEGDGGMLGTLAPSALTGSGILGRRVRYVTGDTETRSDVARAVAKRMIERDRVSMIAGGSSSDAAIAVQSLCQEAGILFMAGLTHSNDTTGKEGKANGFRHFINAWMSAAALAPVLARVHGRERRAYHLTADYRWGWTQEASLLASTGDIGWETAGTLRTPSGGASLGRDIERALAAGADTLILNHYGQDLVDSLTLVRRLGLRERRVNGHDVAIVAPLCSHLTAQRAGEAVKGVYASANWYWKLADAGSRAFVRSFGEEYGFPPSQAAHTCYVQLLLYADACERAGTFAPCRVAAALEGFEFDGTGNGPSEYRAGDHQCFKGVPVVRGREDPESAFDLLEVVETTPRAQVEYPLDHPMFAGRDPGACNDGV